MKKTIMGRKYNTETAKEIAYWTNNRSYSDFSFAEETLFRKRNGEYFLLGRGGAMTDYAHRTDDNSWSFGEEIVPFDEKRAIIWARKRLSTEKFESIFGKIS